MFSLKSIYSFLVQNSFLGNSSINIIAWGSARFWTPGSDASLKYYHIDLFNLDNSMDRIVNIILYTQKFWVRTLEETCDPWYMWSRWWEEMRWPTKKQWQRQRQWQRLLNTETLENNKGLGSPRRLLRRSGTWSGSTRRVVFSGKRQSFFLPEAYHLALMRIFSNLFIAYMHIAY